MTVGELIEYLRSEDPSAEVRVADRTGELELDESPEVTDVWEEGGLVYIETD